MMWFLNENVIPNNAFGHDPNDEQEFVNPKMNLVKRCEFSFINIFIVIVGKVVSKRKDSNYETDEKKKNYNQFRYMVWNLNRCFFICHETIDTNRCKEHKSA